MRTLLPSNARSSEAARRQRRARAPKGALLHAPARQITLAHTRAGLISPLVCIRASSRVSSAHTLRSTRLLFASGMEFVVLFGSHTCALCFTQLQFPHVCGAVSSPYTSVTTDGTTCRSSIPPPPVTAATPDSSDCRHHPPSAARTTKLLYLL